MKNGIRIPSILYNYYNEYCEEIWTTDGTFNGDNHRLDGPAIIDKNAVYWYIAGEQYKFKQFCKVLNLSNEDITIILLKYGKM